MRLLLDTAALIYAVESPARLGKRAAAVISNSANLLEFIAISISEIATKVSLGKLERAAASLRQVLEDLNIRILPYSADHALTFFDLPLHHGDPFDSQIIAQAMCEKIAVVTPDGKFKLYAGLKIVW